MAFYLEPLHTGGRQVVLDKAVVLIGRQAECDVILSDSRKVSRKHCCIAQVNDTFVVRDLASMNGVRVNGERIDREAPLGLGDEISFGDVRYVLRDTRANPMSSVNIPGVAADAERAGPQPAAVHDDESPAANDVELEAEVVTPKPEPPSHREPVNISQKFPVPISDEDVDFAIEPSIQLDRKPSEPDKPDAENGNDVSDDVVLLDDEAVSSSEDADK